MQPGRAPRISAAAGGDLPRLRAACSGDAGAFLELASSRLPVAFRLASAVLGAEVDAADVTQMALVAAWRELPRLRDPAGFDTWFYRILFDECRMRARRRAGDGANSDGAAAKARLEAASTARMLDGATIVDMLEDAFEQLDPDDRALLVLTYLEGSPTADIAAVLHLPAGTVKWRLHEARRGLGMVLESMR